jgi:predicted metalloprotease
VATAQATIRWGDRPARLVRPRRVRRRPGRRDAASRGRRDRRGRARPAAGLRVPVLRRRRLRHPRCNGPGRRSGPPEGASGPIEEGSLADRVDAVFDDLQTTWEQDIFRPAGRAYEETGLVLFTDRTNSGCGAASSATGPFYCPADGLVYLDLGFFRELAHNFAAPGDFAQAYVIAHEVGHHVQSVIGTSAAVQRESREDPSAANELSVRLELQADCFAGVWGASVYERGILEPGDVEEALAAAAAVGDDRIQRRTQGRIDPETFTHGTSEQRARWFRTGFDTGDPEACDTFSGDV